MSAMMTNDLRDQVRVPDGVRWTPKVIRGAQGTAAKPAGKGKRRTRAQINKRLAATRAERLAAAEANALKILGRARL